MVAKEKSGGKLGFNHLIICLSSTISGSTPCLCAQGLSVAQIYQCRQPLPPLPAPLSFCRGLTGALWLISEAWTFDSRPAWQPSSAKLALSATVLLFINTAQNEKNQPEWQLQRHSSPKMWYLITGGFCGGIVYNPKFKSFLNFRRSSIKNPFRIFQSV